MFCKHILITFLKMANGDEHPDPVPQ
jgi:hypothetical protein